jgi:Na+/H+ antiporter NhaD/arsenite permease-like protein
MSVYPPSRLAWILGALVGIAAGGSLAVLIPLASDDPTPLWLCLPFALLLLTIAVAPIVAPRFWHSKYPAVAFLLGGSILGFYLFGFGGPTGRGGGAMLHAAVEYYAFIALVGGLYVASGGILVHIRSQATPLRNTALLAAGAVLANLLGTTGASVLLIRPFMRMNRGRLRPFHVVMFIFIVSNCGGALTPVGDPPLYLGFLKGVPFTWPTTTLWPMWLLVNGCLLGMFYIADTRLPRGRADDQPDPGSGVLVVSGLPSMLCLLLLVAGVFIDPILARAGVKALAHIPVGATFQIVMAVLAYRLSADDHHDANQFSLEPVREVAVLFAGIFLTMVPALEYLRIHAAQLGLHSPTQFYFLTGGLSAVLDNAPTYVSFLQAALGASDLPMNAEGIRQLQQLNGPNLLVGISLGAVFFGALTYIGNGPNFMVRSIVASTHERSGDSGLGTRPPSFFGYSLYALAILLPVLVLNWLLFIR